MSSSIDEVHSPLILTRVKGAKALNTMTFSLTTVSIRDFCDVQLKQHSLSNAIILNVTFTVMMNVTFYCFAECSYVECHYAKCRGAK
jgi:hypothetical protein